MATDTRLDDKELIERIKTGDEDAFSQIYTRYWKILLTVAANKVKDIEEAEEIVQDIFVSLWNRRQELCITSTVKNYLAVAVKYRVIKILAKKQHRLHYNEHQLNYAVLLDNSTQEWLDFEELSSRLGELVAELPERCRLVYKLSKESYLSQKQIAAELEISEKTVESHLARAMKSIRIGLSQFLSIMLL